jgi:AAA ATPase domain
VINPFSPGMSTMPPFLAGREQVFELLERDSQLALAGRGGRVPILIGPRGVGKTVLLHQFVHQMRARGWAARRFEADPGAGGGFVAQLAAAAPSLVSMFEGRLTKSKARDAVARLDSITATINLAVAKVELTGSGRRREEAIPTGAGAIAALITELGNAAKQAKAGVLLAFDELQDAPVGDLRALVSMFQFVVGERLPIMFAAAGLSSLADRATEAGATSFTERAAWTVLGSLDYTETRQAFVEPLRLTGRRVGQDAVAEFYRVTLGYPFVVQLVASHIWDVDVDENITVEDVVAGAHAAAIDLDNGLYRLRWNKCTVAERAYLVAAAAERSSRPNNPISTGAIATRLGRAAPDVDKQRAGLVGKGMLDVAGHGSVTFSLPFYDRYVAFRSQLEAADAEAMTTPNWFQSSSS